MWNVNQTRIHDDDRLMEKISKLVCQKILKRKETLATGCKIFHRAKTGSRERRERRLGLTSTKKKKATSLRKELVGRDHQGGLS